MNKKFYILMLLASIASTNVYAKESQDITLDDIRASHIKRTQNDQRKSRVPTMRAEVLRDVALRIGTSHSLNHYYSRLYAENIKPREAELDRIYNFEALAISPGVMPPVLSQNFSHYELNSDNMVTISDQDYKIEEPARMVSTYPSWRDYLFFDFKPAEVPATNFLPKTQGERLIWDEYVEKGWNEGRQQAMDVYNQAKARLDRDYQGMILYKIALANGQITPTVVASSNMGVTGDGKSISINKRVINITNQSEFIVDQSKWKTGSQKPASYKAGQGRYF